MRKPFFLIPYSVLFCIALMLLVGCNNDKGTDKGTAANPATGDTGKTTAKSLAPVIAGLSSGVLDTLVISATEFLKLDRNKALFIFYFGTLDTISLSGWKDKSGTFNTPPDVRFIKGNPTAIPYGPGTYFGNLVLKNVNQLRTRINTNGATEVIFVPYKSGDHVSYRIFLREPDSLKVGILSINPTGDEANPSPPKPS